MDTKLTNEQFKVLWLGKRYQENPLFGYQCVSLVKLYCSKVWGLLCGSFGGTAYSGWVNRATVFPGKKSVEGFAVVPIGSVVIFKPFAVVKHKKPGAFFWSTEKLTYAGHTGTVDYIDDSGVMRIIEQNGGNGNGNGLGANAIRLRGYKSKDGVAGFILQ